MIWPPRPYIDRCAPEIESQSADEPRQSKVSGLPIQHADKGELFLAVDGIDKWTEVPLSTDLVNYAQPVTS